MSRQNAGLVPSAHRVDAGPAGGPAGDPAKHYWCRMEHTTLPTGSMARVTRAVCSCGWVSDWLRSATRATEAGLDHTADATRETPTP
jgi:hypothetical protein